MSQEILTFDDVDVAKNKTLGQFKADVVIDGITFKFEFDVISDHFIGHDMLVRGELSDYAEIKLKRRCATLSKLDSEEKTVNNVDSGWKQALNVNVLDEPEEEYEVSMNHVVDEKIKNELQSLIKSYQPRKTKDSGVKIRIVLKDDIPVYQRTKIVD